jgi:hypothetical protein
MVRISWLLAQTTASPAIRCAHGRLRGEELSDKKGGLLRESTLPIAQCRSGYFKGFGIF